VEASSNGPLMSDGTSLLWRLVATPRMSRAPAVAMGKAHSSLLEHRSSDRTAVVDRLPIATESYDPSV
jgi:hypothetical protein